MSAAQSRSLRIATETAHIIESLLQRRASLRSLVFASRIKSKKRLYRLCCACLQHCTALSCLLQSELGNKLQRQLRLGRYLFTVLLYEAVLSDKPAQYPDTIWLPIVENKDALRSSAPLDESPPSTSARVAVPRYARVNSLKCTVDEVRHTLTQYGYDAAQTPGKYNAKCFRRHVAHLQQGQYFMDKLVPNLLVFPTGTDLHDCELVKSGRLILMDKSSCLAPFVLAPPIGATVLDACAAPGMKSLYMAASVGKQGAVTSVERDNERVKVLRRLLRNGGADWSTVIHGDFLKLRLDTDARFAQVEYCVVDPPCTGSGIVSRADYLTDGKAPSAGDKQSRALRLANLQAMLLKHALKRLPALKRLVYSTCSVNVEENERVVHEALHDEQVAERFELAPALSTKQWRSRGDALYDFGDKVLRCVPDRHLTNGFFVALFQRKA